MFMTKMFMRQHRAGLLSCEVSLHVSGWNICTECCSFNAVCSHCRSPITMLKPRHGDHGKERTYLPPMNATLPSEKSPSLYPKVFQLTSAESDGVCPECRLRFPHGDLDKHMRMMHARFDEQHPISNTGLLSPMYFCLIVCSRLANTIRGKKQQGTKSCAQEDYIRHHVTEADTLVGLALKYGVTAGMASLLIVLQCSMLCMGS